MIELQNEQLANCLSFDEETFNYPPVEKVPYCLKLICPFWLLPCPRGLSVSGYLLLLPTRPTATLDVHISLLQRQPQAELTVFCLLSAAQKDPGLWEKDERMNAASLPAKGSSRSISFDFVLSPSLYSLGPQRLPLDRTRDPLVRLCLPNNRWRCGTSQSDSFLKQEITLPGKRGHPNRNRYYIIQHKLLLELWENIIVTVIF